MLASVRTVVRRTPLVGRRLLSTAPGSHSDFARQTKVETADAASVEGFIKNTIDSNDVTLFMKGTPEYPQCGFSQQVRT